MRVRGKTLFVIAVGTIPVLAILAFVLIVMSNPELANECFGRPDMIQCFQER